MADISAVRQIIQQESLNAAAAASSSTVQIIGSTVQHHNYFHGRSLAFSANGPYGQNVGSVPDIKVDVAYGIQKNCQIMSWSFLNHIAGSSGNLEIDLIRMDTTGAQTSLFSTKPVIPSSSGNFARLSGQLSPTAVTTMQTAGTTLPVFAVTQLFAGDFIYMNITSKQENGESFDFVLDVIATN